MSNADAVIHAVEEMLDELNTSEQVVFLLHILTQTKDRFIALIAAPGLSGAEKEKIDMKIRETETHIAQIRRELKLNG